MKKLFISVILVFACCLAASAQKIVKEVSPEDSYVSDPRIESRISSAKGLVTAGIVLEIAATACTTTGFIMGVYTTDQNRKTINTLKIAGASAMALSGVMILIGESNLRKIRNSAGQTVATVSLQPTDIGAGLCLRF